MSKPRLLDLFCGAGGAAMGYHRAGFEVVGVDIKPQPRYPFEFIEGDAIENAKQLCVRFAFDAIHASPPCQAFSVANNYRPELATKYPDLIPSTRDLVVSSGLPYVIENVPGAPLVAPTMICGSGLGLPLRRHRLFECSFPLMGVGCAHGQFPWREEYKHSTNRKRRRVAVLGEWRVPFALQKEAAGIDWMTLEELSEAIPPAYTEHIGHYLLAEINARAVA
jgi:DNA (cytosine-5)-methyltransferase 1